MQDLSRVISSVVSICIKIIFSFETNSHGLFQILSHYRCICFMPLLIQTRNHDIDRP